MTEFVTDDQNVRYIILKASVSIDFEIFDEDID